MKYRKKPVVVEAIQYTDDNLTELFNFCNKAYFEHMSKLLVIDTLEGKMYANEGDYIIKGIHGEFYPCKPDVFEETYEAVNMNDNHISVEPKRPFFKTYTEEPTLENTEDGDMVWYKNDLYVRYGDTILIHQ